MKCAALRQRIGFVGMKHKGAHTPIVAVTAEASLRTRRASPKGVMDEYMAKPINDRLLRAVPTRRVSLPADTIAEKNIPIM